MIADLIRVMQPASRVLVYKGVIYVNGTAINKRDRVSSGAHGQRRGVLQ